jgi:hypothetical protein
MTKEKAATSRVWRGGAPWTRSAVDAPPRDWLILYLHAEAEPMRPTTIQHLRFLEHSLTPHNVLYWNAWHGVPAWVRSYPYDVVVLHYSLLCMRWEEPFERWRRSLDWIPKSDAVRIAMPQDDFTCAATLDDWLADLDVQCVFSALDSSQWPVVYPGESKRTRMEHTFTGFVDDRAAGAVARLPKPHALRDLDIIYRARNLPFQYGRRGQLKHEIGQIVEPAARAAGLRTDISTRIEDTKYGDAWFEFLASGRCVIGSESGSSALDPVGAIRRFEAEWRPSHPDATFEEFSALQEPGWDSYDLKAIGPRLFEAAQTKTAQVLVEGRYEGIVEPGTHYFPIREDFSNLTETLERIRDPAETEAVAERAWEDLIASGRYSYGAFAAHVESVVDELAGGRVRRGRRRAASWKALNAAGSVYAGLAIRSPRLAYRAAMRYAPGAAAVMVRGRDALRRRAAR